MTGKKIRAYAGDRGGYNAIEGPLLRALDAGVHVHAFFVGTCAEQFRAGTLKTDLRVIVTAAEKGQDVVVGSADKGETALYVLAASQTEIGTESAATAAYRAGGEGKPVLLVQDFYGSGVPIVSRLVEWRKTSFLTRICVSDEFSKQHMLRNADRRTVPFLETNFQERIVVTGGPQFDKTVKVRAEWAERRGRIRENLGVADEDLKRSIVILIAGQLHGTAEIVALVYEAVARLKGCAFVVLRQHPRATALDQWLTKVSQGADQGGVFFHTVDREIAPASEDCLPGVDLVLSGYSTTNYYGILYEMPGVVYVGTPSFQWDLWREKGLTKPPEVEAGAGWYVETADDLAHVITELQKGDASEEVQKIRTAQRRIVQYNDGHATDRVWGEMQKLLA